MFLIHKPNFTGDQIVDQVQEEIAKLQNTPMDAKEFQRVKTLVRAGIINSMQGSLSRAKALAQYTVVDGNPELINTELDRHAGCDAGPDPGGGKEVPDARQAFGARDRTGSSPQGGQVNVPKTFLAPSRWL